MIPKLIEHIENEWHPAAPLKLDATTCAALVETAELVLTNRNDKPWPQTQTDWLDAIEDEVEATEDEGLNLGGDEEERANYLERLDNLAEHIGG